MPARPIKPKDKARAEVGVQIVERWILACLRHETFFSLAQLNQRISELLVRLNQKPFKKLEGCRETAFTQIDKPALKPLPLNPYEFVHVTQVRVHIDYPVDIQGHYYSVPYTLIKQRLTAHTSSNPVSLYHADKCVAQHPRCFHKSGFTTHQDHMPKAHKAHLDWHPGRFLNTAKAIGPFTLKRVKHRLNEKRHPEQRYRACLGILNLKKSYGQARLEVACQQACLDGTFHYHAIKARLQTTEHTPLPSDPLLNLKHDNIRGPEYYPHQEKQYEYHHANNLSRST